MKKQLAKFIAIFAAILCLMHFAQAQTVTAKSVAGQVFISSEYVVNARADSIIMRLACLTPWPK